MTARRWWPVGGWVWSLGHSPAHRSPGMAWSGGRCTGAGERRGWPAESYMSGKQKEGERPCLWAGPPQTSPPRASESTRAAERPDRGGMGGQGRGREREEEKQQLHGAYFSRASHFLITVSSSSSTQSYGGMTGGEDRRITGERRTHTQRETHRETEREGDRETERREGYYIISTFFPPPSKQCSIRETGSSPRGENDKSNPKSNGLCSVQRAHSVLYSP